jgi:hypothetical protein
MSPYEITYAGGSVEHFNEETGATWMQRLLATYPKAIWLNPEPEQRWPHTPSILILTELMEERMFPLTLGGLERDAGAVRVHPDSWFPSCRCQPACFRDRMKQDVSSEATGMYLRRVPEGSLRTRPAL